MLDDARIGDLLREVAESPVAPGGGTVAGVTVAFAAGLVVKATRASGDAWDDAGGAAAQAGLLGRRALAAGDASAAEFGAAVALLRSATGSGERDAELGAALIRAASAPLAVAGIAADVAILAADAAEHSGAELRPECVIACVLAEACCVASAHLVEINLGLTTDDERLSLCAAYVAQARAARARVL